MESRASYVSIRRSSNHIHEQYGMLGMALVTAVEKLDAVILFEDDHITTTKTGVLLLRMAEQDADCCVCNVVVALSGFRAARLMRHRQHERGKR